MIFSFLPPLLISIGMPVFNTSSSRLYIFPRNSVTVIVFIAILLAKGTYVILHRYVHARKKVYLNQEKSEFF